MITLRKLRYLAALARHRHFGRAAEDCAVTQPALSMQMRELEREIGADLVERRPGEIALTDIGLEVAQRAEHILTATRDLVDFARHRALAHRPAHARHHPDAGALCAAARAAPAAAGLSAIAAGSARDADQNFARRTRRRFARLRDAGAAGGRRRCREPARCSRIRSCWRCRRARNCRHTGRSPSTTSISAGSFCWRRATVCATRRSPSAPRQN